MPPELMRLIVAATERTQRMPQHLREMLASPFVRDTLVPWMGVDPQVQADPSMPEGYLGETLWNGQVRTNPRYAQQGFPTSGRDLPSILAHEFTHVAGQQGRGNPIYETGRGFRRTDDPDEARAYAVEVAMRQIRAGAKTKEQVPEAIRRQVPGFDLMFDWLQTRARQTEYNRRFGRPLPTPEVRDTVRMRIRP